DELPAEEQAEVADPHGAERLVGARPESPPHADRSGSGARVASFSRTSSAAARRSYSSASRSRKRPTSQAVRRDRLASSWRRPDGLISTWLTRRSVAPTRRMT